MKKGIEVEGQHIGRPTLFVDAEELMTYSGICDARIALHKEGIDHIYISDHARLLDPSQILRTFEAVEFVTWEVRSVPHDMATVPTVVEIMLSNCQDFWQIKKLRPQDQVKFSDGQNVVVFSMKTAVFTAPEDFAGDIEL